VSERKSVVRDAVGWLRICPEFWRILLSLTPGENIPLRLLVLKNDGNVAFLKAGNYSFDTSPNPKMLKSPDTLLKILILGNLRVYRDECRIFCIFVHDTLQSGRWTTLRILWRTRRSRYVIIYPDDRSFILSQTFVSTSDTTRCH